MVLAHEPAKRAVRGISPLAEAVSRMIRQAIAEGQHPAGAPLPSERALAQSHSVSRTVVREAMGLLAEEGLLIQSERCRPVVAPTAPRRRPAVARIGVWLWPRADDYAASAIFRGIQRAGRSGEVRLIVGSASHASWDDDVESEARFLRGLVEDEAADGAILWYLGGERNLPVLREARARGLELVFVDRCPPAGFEADFVGTENVGAARAAVAHLVELGHRRIAFVGNLDSASPVAERLEGYRRALKDAGLAAMAPFVPLPDETDAESTRRIAEAILADHPRPTALFAVNDAVALSLLDALRELGVAVPEEMSVVGFDGLLHWVPGGGPLTTAKQNFTTLGEKAGEALLKRLAAEPSSTYRHVLLDAPLSPGGSTARPGTGLASASNEGKS